MLIEVYLDDQKSPIDVIKPPEKFKFDSTNIDDGPHRLLFKVIDEDGQISTRQINFTVRNGPTISIHGIRDNDTLSGEISILANAYGAKIGDEFEPVRMETPRPVPTWAWVLFLIVLGWAAGYISMALSGKVNIMPDTATITEKVKTQQKASVQAKEGKSNPAAASSNDWAALGEQIYGNNCSSCHQKNGMGLPTVFPPLKDNPAVLSDDPKDHITAILNGLSGKTIDGVDYASPMPAFGASLNDDEIAAVVNHERSQWGNNAKLISVDDVKQVRDPSLATKDKAAEETKTESAKPEAEAASKAPESIISDDWQALGKQVYGNNCLACHQATGLGLPSVFPPLKGNPAVLSDDPKDHIEAIINGLSGKTIDGVAYGSPMPEFGSSLNDEQIAAVVNHERSEWGNNAKLINVDDVKKVRNPSKATKAEASKETLTKKDNSGVKVTSNTTESAPEFNWKFLGKQVYDKNCIACHQASGVGLATVFPPLKGNPAVLSDDPKDHIEAILNGLSGKTIDGVAYGSPMPEFGSSLSDEQVAAVVNHERSEWGNKAKLVSADDVKKYRK